MEKILIIRETSINTLLTMHSFTFKILNIAADVSKLIINLVKKNILVYDEDE